MPRTMTMLLSDQPASALTSLGREPGSAFTLLGFFDNADDLLPSTSVLERTLGAGDVERLLLTLGRAYFHHSHYRPLECAPHHEIECFSPTPLGPLKNTSIVVTANNADSTPMTWH